MYSHLKPSGGVYSLRASYDYPPTQTHLDGSSEGEVIARPVAMHVLSPISFKSRDGVEQGPEDTASHKIA